MNPASVMFIVPQKAQSTSDMRVGPSASSHSRAAGLPFQARRPTLWSVH